MARQTKKVVHVVIWKECIDRLKSGRRERIDVDESTTVIVGYSKDKPSLPVKGKGPFVFVEKK